MARMNISLRYLHLVLLPAFCVIHHYYVNFRSVSIADALALFVLHIVVTALLFGFIYFITRKFSFAALACVFVMSFILFFGWIKDLVFSYFSPDPTLQYLMLAGGAVIIFFILLRLVWQEKLRARQLHTFFSLMFAVWILIEIIQAGPLQKKFDTVYAPVNFAPSRLTEKPSIYLLLLDGYPRNDALKNLFKYDNSTFLQQLEKHGFIVDTQSRSNYDLTLFSVASMLTMDYLPLNGIPENEDHSLAANRINEAPLWKFLKNEGYGIVNYSIFRVDSQEPFPNPFIRDYKNEYFKRTFPGRLHSDFPRLFHSKERMTEKEIETVDKYKRYNGARDHQIDHHEKAGSQEFVYLHLMMPHFPYYFDSAGKAIDIKEVMNEKMFTGYLEYANNLVLNIIRKIKALPGKKVIHLFSDHGYREGNAPRQVFFSNLSALYSSDNSITIRNNTTNINQFRSILNQSLNQQFPLLRDSTSYLTK